MKKFTSIFFILIFLFSLSACKKENKTEGQVINYRLSNDPLTLDPQVATDYSSEIVIMNIFEGLTRIDENNIACEGVAESWQTNQDKTEYVFHLRNDATWSNNTPVTADDFVFGIQRAISKDTHYENADKLYCIQNARDINYGTKDTSTLGVQATDTHTLVFKLEYSYEDFPRLVATSPFMPCNEKFFSSSSGQYGKEFDKIIMNGPFKIKNKYSWEPSSKLVLAKNESYKGPNIPKCEGINFSIENKESDNINLIKSKKIDAAPISGEQLTSKDKDDLNLTSFKDTTWGIAFNLNDDFLKENNVRKAFVNSLDKKSLQSLIPSNFFETNNIILDHSEIDGENYRSIVGNCSLPNFDESSSKNAMESILSEQKLKSLPGITIVCPDEPSIKSMVSKIMETWNQTFNSYLNMKPLSSQKLFDTVNSGSYQIAIYKIKAVSNNATDFIKIFKSDNNNNFANLKNNNYDDFLKNAVDELSSSEKINSLFKAENFLIEEGVFYPLYNENRYFASAKNVSGIIFHPYDKGIDFTKAIKTKK